MKGRYIMPCGPIVKPPISLMPKRLHDEKRHVKVVDAIFRYLKAGMKVPIEWVQEYNDLFDTIGK